MKEKVNTVETSTFASILQALHNGFERLKDICWNSDDLLDEEVELPKELLEVREKWDNKAKQLNTANVQTKEKQKEEKGLNHIKVEKSPRVKEEKITVNKTQKGEVLKDETKNREILE